MAVVQRDDHTKTERTAVSVMIILHGAHCCQHDDHTTRSALLSAWWSY